MRALRTEERPIDRDRPAMRGPFTGGPRAWWRTVAVTTAIAVLGLLALAAMLVAGAC